MFADIRRHQKWLWIPISVIVIISFVWYFNPNSQQGAGSAFSSDGNIGSINGRPLSRNEYLNARKEADLRYLFRYNAWHGQDEFSRQDPDFLDRESKTRLVLKEIVKEHNIHVTPAEIAKWISEAFGRERAFTTADYDRFIKEVLQPHGLRERDLERYIRDEVALMHLVNVAGISGKLVTPQEAEAQYRRENEQAAAEAVFFFATNFVAQVNADQNAISGFYTNRAADYRLPERLQLSYVEFPITNYFAEADKTLAGITNLNLMIEEMYRQRGTNFYTDTNNMPMPPEQAKAKIRDDERRRIALVDARKAANDFTEELLGLGAKQAGNLENLAAAKGLVTQTTEPFSQYDTPRDFGDVSPRFGQVAFSLTPTEPFIEEPVISSDGVYVVGFKKRIPSEVPPLDSIRDQVVEDYKRTQSQTLARQAGQTFHGKLTNAIAGGKSFSDAAKELGQAPTTLPPFSQMDRAINGLDPRVDATSIKNAAFALKDNETGPFTMTRDGGFVLHLDKRIPPADLAVKSALPEYLSNLQRSGQNEAFAAWFNKKFQEAKVALVTDSTGGDEAGGPVGAGAPQ